MPESRTTYGNAELKERFGFKSQYDPPGKNEHKALSGKFLDLADYLNEALPASRIKSIAFTELENASEWAHKALAENQRNGNGNSF